jgi:hypothetical protein
MRRQPTRDQTRRARQQIAEGAAKRQVSSAGDDAANKAHRVRFGWCKVVNECRSVLFDNVFYIVNLWYNSATKMQIC